jgi:hypothetical protein
VRALEASTKQMEASAARQLSGATSAGEGSSVELIRVDLTHAQRRAEDAERHEKRATEEAQEERRMREQAEQSHAESLRHLRLTNEVFLFYSVGLFCLFQVFVCFTEQSEQRVRSGATACGC